MQVLDAGDAAMSTVNVCEVVTKYVQEGRSRAAIRALLVNLRIEPIPFTESMALQAGHLRQDTRRLGLSLGDRACLATALQLNLPVYTADQSWGSLQLGIPIHLIR